MDIFDAAERYCTEEKQVIILAGKEYGSGSSRDWAAKGPWMQVSTGLQIEGVLAYFTQLKHQKCIGDDVGDLKYVYTQKNIVNTLDLQS
jgi:aconitate hydratase